MRTGPAAAGRSAHTSNPESEDDRPPTATVEVGHLNVAPFGALYRAQSSRLRRFFARRSAGEDTADLVQDTFERLVRRDTEAVIGRPERYLSRIATNLLRDRAKFAARRAAAFHISIDDVPVATGDPHDLLEARDTLARLEAAMARLSPLTRDIFLACRLDGHIRGCSPPIMPVRRAMRNILPGVARSLRGPDRRSATRPSNAVLDGEDARVGGHNGHVSEHRNGVGSRDERTGCGAGTGVRARCRRSIGASVSGSRGSGFSLGCTGSGALDRRIREPRGRGIRTRPDSNLRAARWQMVLRHHARGWRWPGPCAPAERW